MKYTLGLKLVLFSTLVISCSVVEKNKKNTELLTANHFLIDGDQAKVMLLGSWHFSYPNLDSYQTKKEDMVDLESPERQNEIQEVIAHLKKFNPTIICTESGNQSRNDSLYSAYLDNKHILSISEDQQLGFRLGKQLGLKKINATNAYSWLRKDSEDCDSVRDLWDEEYHLDTLTKHIWQDKYWEYYNYEEKKLLSHSVNECLKYENNPENLKALFGNYLIQLKTSNHNGPDALSLKWYNRNLRIFNNILKTNPQPEDRVLVIYGSSHIAILEQLFDASPQFELVRPYAY